jgi:hypothetical protein
VAVTYCVPALEEASAGPESVTVGWVVSTWIVSLAVETFLEALVAVKLSSCSPSPVRVVVGVQLTPFRHCCHVVSSGVHVGNADGVARFWPFSEAVIVAIPDGAVAETPSGHVPYTHCVALEFPTLP